MAYIRAGRAVRFGRQSFVPGGAACAAAARRFSLSLAPLFAAPAPENARGQAAPALSTQVTRCSAALLAATAAA